MKSEIRQPSAGSKGEDLGIVPPWALLTVLSVTWSREMAFNTIRPHNCLLGVSPGDRLGHIFTGSRAEPCVFAHLPGSFFFF